MYAVVTLLYDASYIPGALVLAVALRKILSQGYSSIELAVLIDELKFSKYQIELLLELYDTLVPVQTVTSTLVDKLANDLGRPELASTFTKIALWNLPYEKVLYLDSDTLPEWESESTILELFRLQFARNKILAVPDSGFPDIFNSGVFMLQPNKVDYENLVELVIQSQNGDTGVSFDGADQGLLNQYFNPQPNWVLDVLSGPCGSGSSSTPLDSSRTSEIILGAKSTTDLVSTNWIKLPFLYNVTPSAQYEYLPAYKYFSDGGYPSAAGPLKKLEREPLAETSARDTLSRYRNTASNYFKGGKQIKLMHFIGPYKPWFSKDVEPVHNKWWDLWHEYYSGKSIDSVVFWEKAASNLAQEELVDLYFKKGKELGSRTRPPQTEIKEEKREYIPPGETKSVPAVSDPQNLCDPENYQKIESKIPPTKDSLWDATREAPPISKDVHKSGFEAINSFQNTWDKPEKDIEIDEDEVVPPYNFNYEQDDFSQPPPPPPPLPVKNLHREYVEPERVFSDSVEFSLSVSKLTLEEEEEEVKETLEDEKEEEEINAIEEKDEEEERRREHENDEIPYYINSNQNFGKIFPWEFRENTPPERSFDDF